MKLKLVRNTVAIIRLSKLLHRNIFSKIMAESKEESLSTETKVNEEEEHTESSEVSAKSEDVFKVPTILPIHIPLKASKIIQKTKFSSPETEEKPSVEPQSAANIIVASDSSAKKPDSFDKFKPKETIPVPYDEPKWSGVPKKPYSFEVIKNGVIVENIDLSSRPYTICGRLANCDIVMEHPSISRYHAIIQYKYAKDGDEKQPEGFYLYDLDSTHGTQMNKNAIKSRTYYRLHVGHLIKFGGSSRSYVLQGPCEDEEEESPLTVTEIKEKKLQEEIQRKKDEEEKDKKLQEEEAAGINWGMGDDAEEDESNDINPFALENDNVNDESYFDDPKKTLRGWFEREGYDLQYNVEEIGQAHFLCKVNLPLDNAISGSVIAEAKVKGKKKEAVIACALEACRILDKHGALRQAAKSRRTTKKKWEDDDYYDSEEDTFLDRTGTIERKRMQRIRKSGKADDVVETYDSLLEKYKKIVDEISELETTLQEAKNREQVDNDDEDSLEAYMNSIKNDKSIDKSVKTNLKRKIAELKIEEKKLERLIKITKPANLPPLVSPTANVKPLILSPTEVSPSKSESAKLPSPIKSPVVKHVELPEIEEVSNVIEKSEPIVVGEPNDQPVPEEATDAGENSTHTSESLDANVDVKEMKQQDDSVKVTPKKSEKRKESQEKKVNKKAKLNYEYDSENPDYHMWMPPDDQSGDGKTKLNERFGY
ncbi:hypothetical protein CHUAL_009458 [Chamberlinius hualienensis]